MRDSKQFVGLLDRGAHWLFVNQAALDYADVSASQVIGRPIRESPWLAERAEATARAVDAARRAAAGEYVEFPEALAGKEGQVRYFMASLAPVQPEIGQPEALLARAWEIDIPAEPDSRAAAVVDAINGQLGELYTNYLRGLQHRALSSTLRQKVLDLTRAALLTLDRSGTIQSFNEAAADLLSGAGPLRVGKPVSDFLPSLRDLTTQPQPLSAVAGDMAVCHPDRGPTRLSYTLHPLPDRTGFALLLGAIPEVETPDNVLVDSREVAALKSALHDGPCNELVALRVRLEHLQQSRIAVDRDLHWVRSWLSQLRSVESSLRALMNDLPTASVKAGTFYSAVSGLTERVSANFDMRCTHRLCRPIDLNNDSVAHNLFLILQEAVTNAVRHSNGSQVEIVIGEGEKNCVEIRDNGDGLQFKNALSSACYGLHSMRLRAKEIEAGISFRVRDSLGSSVHISL